jgi:hypothetical protein
MNWFKDCDHRHMVPLTHSHIPSHVPRTLPILIPGFAQQMVPKEDFGRLQQVKRRRKVRTNRSMRKTTPRTNVQSPLNSLRTSSKVQRMTNSRKLLPFSNSKLIAIIYVFRPKWVHSTPEKEEIASKNTKPRHRAVREKVFLVCFVV